MKIFLGGANYDVKEHKIYIYNQNRLLISFYYIDFWKEVICEVSLKEKK